MNARLSLERAATAELVVFTDQLSFTTDLDLLRELEPDVDFALGDRPIRPGTVFVAVDSEGALFLSALDPKGTGIYLRILKRSGEPTERAVATDPYCGSAQDLTYRLIT